MTKELFGCILAIAVALPGCGPSAAERCAIKLAALEATEREALANIARQRGECEAVAIEFRDDKMTTNCIETLRFVMQIAADTQSRVSARRDDKDIRDCSP